MKGNSRRLVRAILAIALLVSASSAAAQPRERLVDRPQGSLLDGLDKEMNEADLVFYGKLTKIEGKTKTAGIYSYLDFDVMKVFKGELPDSHKVTLMFRGGGDKETGMAQGSSDIPTFNYADISKEYIAFVKGNGEAECPLVNCNAMYEVVNGRIHHFQGGPLFLDSSDGLKLGTSRADKLRLKAHGELDPSETIPSDAEEAKGVVEYDSFSNYLDEQAPHAKAPTKKFENADRSKDVPRGGLRFLGKEWGKE